MRQAPPTQKRRPAAPRAAKAAPRSRLELAHRVSNGFGEAVFLGGARVPIESVSESRDGEPGFQLGSEVRGCRFGDAQDGGAASPPGRGGEEDGWLALIDLLLAPARPVEEVLEGGRVAPVVFGASLLEFRTHTLGFFDEMQSGRTLLVGVQVEAVEQGHGAFEAHRFDPEAIAVR